MDQIPYHYLLEYLPTRYSATFEQEQDRRSVYAFKNGAITLTIKNQFVEVVKEIVGSRSSDWVVLFIPASSQSKTWNRFLGLARYIQQETGVKATVDGIVPIQETESQHLSGRRYDKTDTYRFEPSIYRGKNVILIDDVITSGRSLRTCANKLIMSGAASVRGLFLAKTINPDWQAWVA